MTENYFCDCEAIRSKKQDLFVPLEFVRDNKIYTVIEVVWQIEADF